MVPAWSGEVRRANAWKPINISARGNDGTDLFKKANRNVGCQQAMNIECTETTLASRHGALHGDHLVVADLSMMAADGAEILAVAYAFFCVIF
jgi:hypothetical protein